MATSERSLLLGLGLLGLGLLSLRLFLGVDLKW